MFAAHDVKKDVLAHFCKIVKLVFNYSCGSNNVVINSTLLTFVKLFISHNCSWLQDILLIID